MLKRFRSIYTTIVGAILMLLAVFMFVADLVNPAWKFNLLDCILVMILGWIFLCAKDTLIEGLLLNLVKFKTGESDEKKDG
jgi:membrane-bound ClpP family serine protease